MNLKLREAQKKRGGDERQFNAIPYWLAFLGALFCLTAERWRAIGNPEAAWKINVVAGFGVQDTGLVLLIGYMVFTSGDSIKRLFMRPATIAIIGLLLAATLIGLLRDAGGGGADGSPSIGRKFFLTNDLRGFLWVIGGYGVGILMMRTGRYWDALLLMCVCFTCLLYAAGARGVVLHDRLLASSMYEFAYMLQVPLAILAIVVTIRQLVRFIAVWAMLGVYTYVLVIQGATRTNALIALAIISMAIMARMRSKKVTLFAILILICGAGWMILKLADGASGGRGVTEAGTVVNRFKGTNVFADGRTEELLSLFTSLKLSEWLVGRGLGGVFQSGVVTSGTVHIGIFFYLLKAGIGLLVIAVYYFYILVPYKFFASIGGCGRSNSADQVASRIAMPGILVMSLVQATSGSLYEVTAPGLGLALFTYIYVKRGAIASHSLARRPCYLQDGAAQEKQTVHGRSGH